LRGMHTLDSAIHCMTPGLKLAGPAFTILAEAGSIITVHKALLEAPAGSVLVIGGETSRDPNSALLGKLMVTQALARGILGAVVDGAVRDVADLRSLRFPVFARCTTPRVGMNRRVGTIQTAIPCGGLLINPGDFILGDDDGVVVIPSSEIEEVVSLAEERLCKEDDYLASMKNGSHITDLIGFTKLIYPEENHDAPIHNTRN
jgi:4-hydroxy-4-methyl-2-oxoglutarate aldolase